MPNYMVDQQGNIKPACNHMIEFKNAYEKWKISSELFIKTYHKMKKEQLEAKYKAFTMTLLMICAFEYALLIGIIINTLT